MQGQKFAVAGCKRDPGASSRGGSRVMHRCRAYTLNLKPKLAVAVCAGIQGLVLGLGFRV
jgi:hypothetical protein